MRVLYHCDVLLRAAKLSIALSLVFSIGFHWAILQSVAWAGMFAEFSQEYSWRVALKKTFSGEETCRLCKFVRHGQQQEKKDKALKVETKLDHWVLVSDFSFEHLDSWFDAKYPAFADVLRSRTEIPPTPPPRIS